MDQKHHSKLDKFISSHKNLNPEKWTENQKKSIYINFYNASMIYNLLKYSEKSKVCSQAFLDIIINKISVPGGSIWSGDYKVNLGGYYMNLDEIEHGLIRGKILKSKSRWHLKTLDPRVHAALNCAAVSCPILANKPFASASVDRMYNDFYQLARRRVSI